jgi:hypothetical protein
MGGCMGVVQRLRGNSPSGFDSDRGPVTRRMLLAGGFAGLLSGYLRQPTTCAANRGEADTSQATRDEAVNALPLADLTAETRRKLMAVCERPTIFRRLPQESVPCDPALHVFLIRNPEVVVNIWQLMDVANMSAQRQGPFLWKGNDGAGTTCDVELVYGTNDTHVIYSDGFYEGSLLKNKVLGRCVLVLRSNYAAARDGRPYVANRLDLFLQIDNLAADAVARTLSPWVGKVADANFHESCVFASKLSSTAETNNAGVQRLAEKLTKVEPPVREEFTKVALAVHERAAARTTTGVIRR